MWTTRHVAHKAIYYWCHGHMAHTSWLGPLSTICLEYGEINVNCFWNLKSESLHSSFALCGWADLPYTNTWHVPLSQGKMVSCCFMMCYLYCPIVVFKYQSKFLLEFYLWTSEQISQTSDVAHCQGSIDSDPQDSRASQICYNSFWYGYSKMYFADLHVQCYG